MQNFAHAVAQAEQQLQLAIRAAEDQSASADENRRKKEAAEAQRRELAAKTTDLKQRLAVVKRGANECVAWRSPCLAAYLRHTHTHSHTLMTPRHGKRLSHATAPVLNATPCCMHRCTLLPGQVSAAGACVPCALCSKVGRGDGRESSGEPGWPGVTGVCESLRVGGSTGGAPLLVLEGGVCVCIMEHVYCVHAWRMHAY